MTRKRKTKRAPTAYQQYFGDKRKQGWSVAQISEGWATYKTNPTKKRKQQDQVNTWWEKSTAKKVWKDFMLRQKTPRMILTRSTAEFKKEAYATWLHISRHPQACW